jgi:hypothetical protein
MYVQGFSTSMPLDVQIEALATINGLEHARIVRPGYAIEYDCIDGRCLTLSMMHKEIPGLFFAGQIVGSSGYEEAAAQGILAGLNASLYVRGEQPLHNLGVERELVMTRQLIRRACGEFVTLFRPPGGNYDPQVRDAVMSTGFSTVFWTENITSYPGQSGPEILPKMLHKIDRSGIVLLHNGFDETREVLPLLLPALQARGLRMDTVSALTSHRPFRTETTPLYPSDWKL